MCLSRRLGGAVGRGRPRWPSTSSPGYRSAYVVQRPEHAGHAMHTIIVDDLDALVAEIARRGLEPAHQETYSNGVRKFTYVDPEGNEVAFGAVPR